MKYAGVLLDQQMNRLLDYAIPEGCTVCVGMRVEVPLRGKLRFGTVSEVRDTCQVKDPKPIARVLGGTLPEPLWKLSRWMSDYYLTPLQKVLKCFVPPNERKEVKAPTKLWVSLACTHEAALQACAELQRKAVPQAALLEAILKRPRGLFAAELLDEVGTSRSPLTSLQKRGLIELKEIATADALIEEEEFFRSGPKKLNEEQAAALAALAKTQDAGQFAVHLIHGVTGSGKTEVYLQAIERALSQGKGALLLVPEISLTSQTIERIRSRFTERVALLHHRRSLGERAHAWAALQNGSIRIAVGARSAVFAPVPKLGLIVVDEEHDGSYKQSEEMPTYSARDVAIMRGKLEGAAVVLGSATPSLESFHNAERGRYQLHRLRSRATVAQMPVVKIVDLAEARDRAGGFTHFCDELLEGIKKRVDAGEQTLIFLNKRGYHRLQVCGACRAPVKCPRCDLGLTYHRAEHLLACHLCDYQIAPPRSCPACGSASALQFQGFGTEHVERSLHAMLPGIRTLRMDRDTTRKKESHETLFQQFKAHKADVLIGTQMIAKGFHFPAATLVGVLHADASLLIPDFRAAENAFQLLTQVAGRAGRAELPGEVIFQTYLPNHPILRLAAAQDYDTFYASEIAERRLFNYPPACHLIKALFSGPDLDALHVLAMQFRSKIPGEVLPVTPPGHPKINDRHRLQFLIKTPHIAALAPHLTKLPPLPKGVTLLLDVDPRSNFF